MKTQQQKKRGFTLIELMLVLVILTVLAAVVVPKFTGRSEQARIAAAKTGISNVETALEMFETDNGAFPSGLDALIQQPANSQNWNGPYIKRGIPKDPWGNVYIYAYPGTHNANSYDLYSFGRDGREGNDDITNWTE